MKKMKKKNLKHCQRCEEKTEQEKTSEGFGGKIYYNDFTCSVCGAVNSFVKKGLPKFVTEYCINTGGY